MREYEKPDMEVMWLYEMNIITTSPDSLQQNNKTDEELTGPWG